MTSMATSAKAVLLLLVLLATSSFFNVENHAAMINWKVAYRSVLDRDSNEDTSMSLNGSQQQQQEQEQEQQQQQQERQLQSQTRRNLESEKPVMDEATQQKQMKSYLGGLYPPMDKDSLPAYLRDTLDNYVQLLDLYNPSGEQSAMNRDLVFFWHIPNTAGNTMKNIMNFCFDLRRAEQLKAEPSMEYERENILNMDTSSPNGLSASFQNQLVNSNLVDVIITNYFLSGSALFTDLHHGKTFTILRHPIYAALSLFHLRRKTSRKDWMQLSFQDYVSSDHYMDSWMVRQLTGSMPWVELDESHFERAKLTLKQKIFVGIMEQMDETVRQLKVHFGWREKTPLCSHNYLHDNPPNENSHPGLPGGRGGKTWNVLVVKEKWDISLYHYGLELFAAQSKRYPADRGDEFEGDEFEGGE